jgi:hypothetical protein
LLKVSQVNQLCLQCHTLAMSSVPSQPPIGPAHNQAQKYQACTMCHAFIHGLTSARSISSRDFRAMTGHGVSQVLQEKMIGTSAASRGSYE